MSKSDIDWITNNPALLAISGAVDNYDELVKQGIDMIINVRAEQHDDIDALTRRNIAYFWIPIADYQAPRRDQIKTFLNIVRMHEKFRILVHCATGRGRSAMLLAAYLIETHKISVEEAVRRITEKRPEVSLTPAQLDKLKLLYG